MSLSDFIKGWFLSNADQLLLVTIPDPEAEPLVADQSYFGLWLTHGFLARDVQWLSRRYPAVHVSARLAVANSDTTLTKLAQPTDGATGHGVWTNFQIVGPIPYRGGTIEIEAGLSALESDTYLGAALSMLSEFSGLVVPPLTEAIAIAGKVSSGIQKVLEEGKEEIVLGLHQTLAASGGGGDNTLAPGYLAIVNTPAGGDLRAAEFLVHESRLHTKKGEGSSPLEGYDYMLFRIESRRQREDWRLPHFETLIGEAIDAHFAGKTEEFEGLRNALLAEVWKSPELTPLDRRRVAIAIAEELKEITSLGAGATGTPQSTLEEIVDRRAPDADSSAVGDLTLADLIKV
jgi:hypothetical protein